MNQTICFKGPSCEKCKNTIFGRKFKPDGLIFIHNRKCAGTSMAKILGRPKTHDVHQYAIEARTRVGNEAWEKAFKFSFTRNPWGRWVSLYRQRIGATKKSKKDELEMIKKFRSYTQRLVLERLDLVGVPFTLPPPCWYKITDAGEIIINFVGSFERLTRDWILLSEKIGVNFKLFNINPRPSLPYQEYYDDPTRDAIWDVYQKDVENFNYVF